MTLRRVTFYFVFLLVLAGTVGFVPALQAAPPHFFMSLDYSPSDLSPFPKFDVPFLASITPAEYVRLNMVTDRRIKPYEFEYYYSENTVKYTRTIKKDVRLIPVTSDIDDFMNRRMELSLSDKAFAAGKKSLVKAQRDKTGGLLQITVPIRSKTFESIFGEGGAGLKVSGFRKITFSGRSSWSDNQTTAFNRQSKFPSLDMEQVYRFDITGTIGSKITVKVSQDSRNDIPLANRLILRYKGNEDDILQTVEAGNTTLNLPSTQFLKYSTRVQGLFGIKASAKIADFSITAIASQEKGNTESVEITAGSSSQSTTVKKDNQYKERTVYDLGRLPIDRAMSDTITEDLSSYDFLPGDSILKAIVYLDNRQFNSPDRTSFPAGICYLDPTDSSGADPSNEYTATGNFEDVDGEDYYINPTSFYVQFLTPVVGTDDIVAVYMEVLRSRNGDVFIDTIGDLSADNDTLTLKLIKPSSHTDVNHHIWEYEWKNIYSLGTRQIDLADLEITIYKGSPLSGNRIDDEDLDNQDGVNFLEIFGLDQFNESNQPISDGKIDKNIGLIDPNLGILYFRDRHPFDSPFSYDTTDGGSPLVLLEPVPELYNTTNPTTISQSSRYYMAITSKSRGQSEIDLKTSNIIQGSEVVTYNGKQLSEGTDYRIQYDFGTLTLLKDEYSDINSNLSVMFETAPFFSLSKKTLLGTRIEYSSSRNLKLGGTMLYKSDKSTNRKPKVGEETSKIMVFDFDFSLRFENPLLTKAVSLLPFVTSQAASHMSLTGEFALSFPDPNVDGQVYIDDFEGSKDSYSLGIGRTHWRKCSRPETIDTLNSERGRLAWYNPIDGYTTEQIWNRDEGDANIAHVMVVEFEPVDFIRTIDTANKIIDSVTTPLEPEQSWNGFMLNIPEGAVSQLVNVQLLEMRVRGDVGILHFDLGRISEDIDGDKMVDTEDKDGLHILDPDEDVGLDGLPDSLEFGYDPANGVNDPAGDNFNASPSPDKMWQINGTEGNAEDSDGGYLPDTEDPRPYDGLNRINSYFSYKVDLSDPAYFEVEESRNEFEWKTIRIPLRDQTAIDTMINDPAWNIIEYARVWIDSSGLAQLDNPITIEIASIELVSTTWGDSLYIADSLRGGPVGFDVSVINTETDLKYTPPPGVEGYHDVARDIIEKEQSLLLTYDNLNARILVNSPDSGLILAADTGLAVRKMFRSANYMGYGKLEAYVHGDENLPEGDSVRFFFRIGYDKNAYYEYRTILKPGWDPDNHVLIEFDEITGLKAQLIEAYKSGENDSSLIIEEGKYLIKAQKGFSNPSLTRIQYFSMGVINLNPDQNAAGEVWIDELRLTDVRDDAGKAARISTSGNVSDLITYSASYSSQDAYYRGVGSSTKGGASNNLGSGQTRTNYSFSGTFKLEKFFPRSLEMSMPISVNWSQSVSEPLLRSGTDIIVPDELIRDETSVTVTKGIRVKQSFSKKTGNIIFSVLLNRLTTSFNYNISEGHSPQSPYFLRERYDAKASYSLSMRKIPAISPLKWAGLLKVPFGLPKTKLYLYPQKLTFSGSMNGSFSRSLNQIGIDPTSTKRSFRGSMNMNYKLFDNLSSSYSFTTTRDLQDPETIKFTINPKTFKLGIEQNYSQSFSASYSPSLFSFVTHKVDYSSRYSDQFRVDRDSVFFHNASLTRTANLNVSLKHEALFGTNRSSRGRGGVKRADSSSIVTRVYRLTLKGIRYLTDAIKPISARLGNSENMSYPKLADKAVPNFRFGLTDDPGVERIQTTSAGNVIESKTVTKTLSGKSGVSLFSGIGADVSFSRSTRESFNSSPTKSISETWPDLKFNLRSIKGLWYLGRIINKISPSSGFVRSHDKRLRTNSPFPYEEKDRRAFAPLISFTVAPIRALRSTFRYEKGTTETTKFNESDGEIKTIVKGTTQSFGFNSSYSLRSPNGIKLPFLGRLKFQSTLSLSVDVSFKKSSDETASAANDYEFKTTSEKTNLSIRPSGAYSFSTTVKGGISGRWQDTNDLRTKQKRHTRELSIWVEMRF
ncbi:MAG: cell surface protein SprA [FCB group bacterium]|nr:cell surface protein SprA [FCB group bacterium]